MAIDPWYWVFAAAQTLLPLVALTCAGLYLAWWWDTRRAPPPPLRTLLLLIALFDVAIALDSLKWIADRAFDPGRAVATIKAAAGSAHYVEAVSIKTAQLTIAAAQLLPVWRVRRHDLVLFAVIFAGLASAATLASGLHWRQIESHVAAARVSAK